MKKRISALLLTFVMLMGLLPQGAFAGEETAVYLSISCGGEFLPAADGKAMANREVKLSGKESYNIDDVFRKAHELYFEGGEDGYLSYEGDYGLSLSKLWGDSSGNFGYFLNGDMAWGLADSVSSGNRIEGIIYKGVYPNMEGYAKFDSFEKTADENGEAELELSYISGYDENYNPVFSPCVGAEITVDLKKSGIKTDSEGKAKISLEEGRHIVSAVKTRETGETAVTEITAPVCTVIRNGIFCIRNSLGEETPEDGYSYFAGEEGETLSVYSETESAAAYQWRYKTEESADKSFNAGTNAEIKKQSFKIPTVQDGIRYYYCKVTYKKDGKNTYYETKPVKVSVTAQSAEEPNITDPKGAEYLFGSASAAPLSVKATVSDGGKLSFEWYKKAEGDEVFQLIENAAESSYVPKTDILGTTCYKCRAVNTVESISGEVYTAYKDSAEAKITVKSLADYGASWEGEGSEEKPYLMKTGEDLAVLSKLTALGETFKDKYFLFADDITLPESWTPIGSLKDGVSFNPVRTTAKDANLFSGNINGGGHLLTVPKGSLSLLGACSGAYLSNLDIYGDEIAGCGVMEYYIQGTDIEINSVTLKSGTKTLKSGFIGGYAKGSDYVVIRNSVVEEGVIIGYDKSQSNIGSFGGDFNGLIENCKSGAKVFGVNFVGGIAGSKGQSMGQFIIRECDFSGELEASGKYAGGIAGHGYGGTQWGFANNAPWATIQNCSVFGSIKAENYAGGILGAEAGVSQCWENGTGYIQNNFFGGNIEISASGENAYMGAVCGYIKSIGRYTVISGNYYAADCGAQKGIGSIAAVDSSEKYGIEGIEPGADPKEFSDAAESLTVAAEKLNSGLNSSGTWKYENGALIRGGEKHIIKIETEPALAVKGGIKITKGDELEGYSLAVFYSDGTKENVSLDLAEKINCDFSVAGNRRGEIIYNNHQYVFMLNVPNAIEPPEPGESGGGSNPSGNITVKFTLLGDKAHGESGEIHTLEGGNLETWILKTSVSVSAKSTVMDVFAKVLSKEGFSWVNENKKDGTKGNYIQSITNKKGIKLAEFTNGEKSGWMYKLNGTHPLLGVSEQTLKDGDEIIFHYTDDYSAEEGSKKWRGSSSKKTENKTDKKEETNPETDKKEETKEERVSFKDVDANSWYAKAAEYTAKRNIFRGTEKDIFAPEEKLERAMLAAVLHRLEGEPKAEGEGFKDIGSESWCYNAVLWAKAAGITEGNGNGNFEPEGEITREQLAAMLYRFAEFKNYKSETKNEIRLEDYKDYEEISEYAKKALKWAAEKGIITGTPENKLCPKSGATRAETAVMLMRFCEKFGI